MHALSISPHVSDSVQKDLVEMTTMVRNMASMLKQEKGGDGSVHQKILSKLTGIESKLTDMKKVEDLRQERQGLERVIESLKSRLEASRREYRDSVNGESSQRSSAREKPTKMRSLIQMNKLFLMGLTGHQDKPPIHR